jgi:hypothetical protein
MNQTDSNNRTVDRSVKQSGDRSINQTIKQSNNQTIKQSIDNQSINQLSKQIRIN